MVISSAYPSILLQAARHIGFKPLNHLHGTQHEVWHVRMPTGDVVIKIRRPEFGRRLEKEATWLRKANSLGIPTPQLLAHFRETSFHAILTRFINPARQRALTPRACLELLSPLHLLKTTAGWGSLRADGMPRWKNEQSALTWYLQLGDRLGMSTALQDRLVATWTYRQRGIIHGDCHRANLIGTYILDWENVAQADPYEEAARISLARSWPRPWAWLGADPAEPRWQGAWLRSCLESAAFPGPRQIPAQKALTALFTS